MKTLWTAMLVAILGLNLGMLPTAEAKRLGGGGSVGRQSQSMNRQALPPSNQATTPAKQAAPATPANNAAANAARPSPWKGILGGALLGLGLGALLSHLGIGGALASVIGTILTFALIALAVMFIIRLLRKKSQPDAMRPAYAHAGMGAGAAGGTPASFGTPEIGSRINNRVDNRFEPAAQPAAFQGSSYGGSVTPDAAPTAAAISLPADFDAQSFVRHAKTNFIRLQAAWDRADINDIREFTTPEMFGELRLQLQERGASPNATDVVSLDGDMLGVETVGDEYLASVKFSGMIRESENAPAEPFAEIWNLSKPVDGSRGWLLAGIQQVN